MVTQQGHPIRRPCCVTIEAVYSYPVYPGSPLGTVVDVVLLLVVLLLVVLLLVVLLLVVLLEVGGSVVVVVDAVVVVVAAVVVVVDAVVVVVAAWQPAAVQPRPLCFGLLASTSGLPPWQVRHLAASALVAPGAAPVAGVWQLVQVPKIELCAATVCVAGAAEAVLPLWQLPQLEPVAWNPPA
jgi:hypothetical protein